MSASFVARVSRRRSALSMLLWLGLVALGAWLSGHPDVFLQVVGWANVLLFGLLAVVSAREALRTGPVLTVDDAGMRWVRWSDETIPWPAITRAAVVAMRGQPFLCLWLIDRTRYRSSHPLAGLTRVNRALGFGDIAIAVAETDRRFDELVAAVAARRLVER